MIGIVRFTTDDCVLGSLPADAGLLLIVIL